MADVHSIWILILTHNLDQTACIYQFDNKPCSVGISAMDSTRNADVTAEHPAVDSS